MDVFKDEITEAGTSVSPERLPSVPAGAPLGAVARDAAVELLGADAMLPTPFAKAVELLDSAAQLHPTPWQLQDVSAAAHTELATRAKMRIGVILKAARQELKA